MAELDFLHNFQIITSSEQELCGICCAENLKLLKALVTHPQFVKTFVNNGG